jgi:hypothetical protein
MADVSIKIGGDSQALVAALKQGGDAFQAFVKKASTESDQLNTKLHQLSGGELLREANQYAEAVQHIGGASKLTADEKARLNAQLTAAIDKYKALGQQAPAALQQLAKDTEQVEKKTSLMSTAVKTAGAAIVASFTIGAITRFAGEIIDAASHIVDLANKTGFSTEEIQRLQYAAKLTGTDVETLSQAAFKLGVNIENCTDPASDFGKALEAIGLSLDQVKQMKPEEFFAAVNEGLTDVKSTTEQNRLGVILYGRDFASMAGSIRDGLADIRRDAIVTADAQIRALNDAGEAWDKLKLKAGEYALLAAGDVAKNTLKIWNTFNAPAATVESLEEAERRQYESISRFAGGVLNLQRQAYLVWIQQQRDAAAAAEETTHKQKDLAKATTDYTAVLKKVRDEVAALKPEQKAQIDAGIKLGVSHEDLSKQVNVSAQAISLYVEQTKQASSESGKAAKSIEVIKAAHRELFGQDLIDRAKVYVEAMKRGGDITQLADEKTEQLRKTLHEALEAYRRLGQQAPAEMLKLANASAVALAGFERFKTIRSEDLLGNIDRTPPAPVVDFGFEKKFKPISIESIIGPIDRKPPTFPAGAPSWLTDWASKFPAQLANAFTGGGGWKGALQATTSTLGADLFAKIAGKPGAGGQPGSGLAGGMTGLMGTVLSSAFPVIGALAGPLIGKVFEHFKKVEYKEIAKDVGRQWGTSISDGLAQQIEKDAKEKFKKDRAAGSLFNLDAIIAEGGGLADGNLEKYTRKLRDVFSMIDQGKFSIAQAGSVLDKNWNAFVTAGTDANGNLSDSLIEIIQLNRQFGTESKAIAAYLKTQAANNQTAFGSIVEAAHDATDNWHKVGEELRAAKDGLDELKKSGKASQDELTKATERYNLALANQKTNAAAAKQEVDDLGLQALLAYNTNIKAGMDPLQAAQGAGIATLRQAYADLGLEVENAALAQIFLSNQLAERNPRLAAGVGALTQSFIALRNSGIKLSADEFAAMERTGSQMYTRLQAEFAAMGKTGEEGTRAALSQMQNYLHEAQRQAKELGIPLDDNTQELIRQSQELGIWKDIGPSAAEKTAAAMEKVAEVMGGVADRLDQVIGKFASLAGVAGAAAAAAAGVWGGPSIIPEPGDFGPGEKTPIGHRGGLVMRGQILHDGGPVFEKRGGAILSPQVDSDDVPALLRRGEYVLNRDTVRAGGIDLFRSLNNARTPDAVTAELARANRFKQARIESGLPFTSAAMTARATSGGNADVVRELGAIREKLQGLAQPAPNLTINNEMHALGFTDRKRMVDEITKEVLKAVSGGGDHYGAFQNLVRGIKPLGDPA